VQPPRDEKPAGDRDPADPGDPNEPAARAHPKDLLHGVTLKSILEQLHAYYGWEHLGRVIPIRCFTHDPSMGSSLAFLRRQPWARSEVEALFLRYKKRELRERKLALGGTGRAEPASDGTDEAPR
jgi:uncharacterized protein (DUF2132 family)